MIALRLLKGYRLWNTGEVAGFPQAEADELIAAGIACAAVEPEEQQEPVTEPEEPARTSGRR